jgi:hypothetical protein
MRPGIDPLGPDFHWGEDSASMKQWFGIIDAAFLKVLGGATRA